MDYIEYYFDGTVSTTAELEEFDSLELIYYNIYYNEQEYYGEE